MPITRILRVADSNIWTLFLFGGLFFAVVSTRIEAFGGVVESSRAASAASVSSSHSGLFTPSSLTIASPHNRRHSRRVGRLSFYDSNKKNIHRDVTNAKSWVKNNVWTRCATVESDSPTTVTKDRIPITTTTTTQSHASQPTRSTTGTGTRTLEEGDGHTFSLNEYILKRLPHIEQALEKSLVSVEPQTDHIVEAMKYSLMAGGKRIRPILCLAAAELVFNTNTPPPSMIPSSSHDHEKEKIETLSVEEQEALYEDCWKRAMPAAVALEMIHTMSLIHDDLPSMDNDDLRRGKPTCHVVYGEDIAILAGDALLSTAFQHVAEHVDTQVVDPLRVLTVLQKLGQSVGPKGLAGGQVMDLLCEGQDNVAIDDLRWIHTHKTAALLVVSVASGALLGGASPDQVAALEEFALKIGLAFQVADDILDVTQSTKELGKTAGKDEDTSKTTFPKLLGLEGSRAEAKRLAEEAKGALDPFGDRAIPLLAMADYIVNRKN